jgi:flavin reductase (DIM6/NTAB) family NADH-FMN oxidoreductase RutF
LQLDIHKGTDLMAQLDAAAAERAELRRAMGRFATGVTVVTTCGPGGKLEGVTSNSFSTVSLDPPLVLWSLARRARSFDGYVAASHFVINVLGLEQIKLSQHFATAQPDKLSGIDFRVGHGGCPVLAGTIAHFECVKENMFDGGDHTIFIGRIIGSSFREGEPLVFAGGDYHRVLPFEHRTAS